MKTSKFKLNAAAIGLVAASLLIACGGGEDLSPPPEAPRVEKAHARHVPLEGQPNSGS